MFNFNRKKINYKQKLGSGVSATVYPYQKDPEDKRWVVKRIVTDEVKKVLGHVNEIVLAFNCDHHNVLPIKGYHIGYNEDENLWEIYMKLQRMKCSLKTIIDQHKKTKEIIKEDIIIRYFYEAIKGLQYLHSKNIAHRDIKPDNLLLDADDTLKVADFGEGNLVDMEASYIADKAGSVLYAAPENKDQNIRMKKTDLFKADYWSLGMVVLELCTLDIRFVDVNSTGMQKQADVRKRIQELRGRYSDILLDLILDMLQCEPSNRKGLKDIQGVIETNFSRIINMEKQRKSIQVKMESSESVEMKKLKEIVKDLENSVTSASLKLKELGDRNDIIEEMKLIESLDEKKMLAPKEKDLKELKPVVTEEEIENFVREFKGKWGNYYGIRKTQEGGVEVNCGSFVGTTDQEMKEITSHIILNLPNLQHLSLSFPSGAFKEPITDQGMKEVASQIALNLPNLQHLSLSFSSRGIFAPISDQGIKKIASQIVLNLPNLQHLSLRFSSHGLTESISNQRIKEIASQVRLNPGSLTSFVLNDKLISLS